MYSKEDLQVLCNDYKLIENFVRKNYIPKLIENERITVSFGDSGKNSFSFCSDYIHVSCDSNTFSFTQEPGMLGIYSCPDGAVSLVLNWHTVKDKIESVFLKRAKTRILMRNFNVGCSSLDELLECQESQMRHQ